VVVYAGFMAIGLSKFTWTWIARHEDARYIMLSLFLYLVMEACPV